MGADASSGAPRAEESSAGPSAGPGAPWPAASGVVPSLVKASLYKSTAFVCQAKASWGCHLLSFTSLPLRHYLTNTNLPLPKLMQSNCTNLDFQHPASAGRGVSAKQDYIHSKALRWSLPCHISRPGHSIKLLFCARETEASSWKAFQGQGIFS